MTGGPTMTLKESVFAWAARMAENEGVVPHHFLIQGDGFESGELLD